jgi:hypothetical protein
MTGKSLREEQHAPGIHGFIEAVLYFQALQPIYGS